MFALPQSGFFSAAKQRNAKTNQGKRAMESVTAWLPFHCHLQEKLILLVKGRQGVLPARAAFRKW